jgi:hypothetical protein
MENFRGDAVRFKLVIVMCAVNSAHADASSE